MGKKSKRYRADVAKQPKETLPLGDAVAALKKIQRDQVRPNGRSSYAFGR